MGIPAPGFSGALGLPPLGDLANGVVEGSFADIGPGAPFAFYGAFDLVIWGRINTALTTSAGSTSASVASGAGLAAGNAINSVLVPPGTTIYSISTDDIVLALPPISQYGLVTSGSNQLANLGQTTGLIGATVTGDGIPASTTVLAVITPAVNQNGGVVELSANATASSPNGNSNQLGRPYNATALTFLPTGSGIPAGTDSAALFVGAAIDYTGSVQLERSFDGGSTWIVAGVGGTGTQAVYAAGTPISVVVGEPERSVLYRLNCTAFTTGPINYRISTTGQAAVSLAVAAPI